MQHQPTGSTQLQLAQTDPPPRSYSDPRPEQWAWIAGLFEGEGTISFYNGKRHHSVRLSVKMTDLDVLERLDALLPSPSGIKVVKFAPGHRKQQYTWGLNRHDSVRRALQGMLPWFGQRRSARARAALARLSGNHGRGRSSQRCKYGHLVTGSNAYLAPDGYLQCRRCKKEHRARRRQPGSGPAQSTLPDA